MSLKRHPSHLFCKELKKIEWHFNLRLQKLEDMTYLRPDLTLDCILEIKLTAIFS